MKFKVGDRVIVVSTTKSGANSSMIGGDYICEQVNLENSLGKYCGLNNGWYIYEDDLELFLIHDSPLYQALR